MMKKTIFVGALASLILFSSNLYAEDSARKTKGNGATSLSLFYDLGADRQLFTTTIEGFYTDPWGSTFFFVDHDYPMNFSPAYANTTKTEKALGGTYWEIARALNFWHNSPVKDLSAHIEYNGGAYRQYAIRHAFLVGVEYLLHNKDYSNTFTFQLLYKNTIYPAGVWSTNKGYEKHHQSLVPLQFTFVWGMNNIGGVKGLNFSGFIDVWGEDHYVFKAEDWAHAADHNTTPRLAYVTAITEPQLWYAFGQHFGCDNLNIGTEVEISWDFGATAGFRIRPCLGLKWVF